MYDLLRPVVPKFAERNEFTVSEFVQLQEFGYLTEGSLRHLIYKSQPRLNAKGAEIPGNGMIEAGVIIRLGRKVLIDAEKFRDWIKASR